jgi:hypothetical protein
MAKQKIQTTIIGSINIQSAKGNSKYLENILNTCDILCIQEHWLLSLEKKILENMHKDFNVSAKAVDDDDIKLNYKSLRGNDNIVGTLLIVITCIRLTPSDFILTALSMVFFQNTAIPPLPRRNL